MDCLPAPTLQLRAKRWGLQSCCQQILPSNMLNFCNQPEGVMRGNTSCDRLRPIAGTHSQLLTKKPAPSLLAFTRAVLVSSARNHVHVGTSYLRFGTPYQPNRRRAAPSIRSGQKTQDLRQLLVIVRQGVVTTLQQ